jgi:hypothetical protein
MKLDFILSPDLQGKFEVVNTTLPALHSSIGYVDFRTMTLDEADRLVKAGTIFLKAVKKRKIKSAV